MASGMRVLDLASSALASALRPSLGRRAATRRAPQDAPDLELYEFEACPFCRKVREAVCALDLAVDIRPCPKGGSRFRPEAVRRGGKAQFPYLVDRSAGLALYESNAIVRHLFDRYGNGGPPAALQSGALRDGWAALSMAPRLGRGGFARPSRAPAQPLELWSFEACPFCRLVRERMCALELPYRLHSTGEGGSRREALAERLGRPVQVPFLVDPNTGTELLESEAILAYLDETYAAT